MSRSLISGLLVSLLLGGCGDQSMTQQNRYGTFTPAALFDDGTEAQQLPAGTIAQGDLERAQQASKPRMIGFFRMLD